MSESHHTLVALLDARSADQGGYTAVRADGGYESMSFGDLAAGSAVAANALATVGSPGTPVVLSVAEPLAFIRTFFAAMRAGLTPVPAPTSTELHPAQRRRLRGIVRSAQAAAVVVDADRQREVAVLLGSQGPAVLAAEDLVTGGGTAPTADRRSEPDSPAYVQYTSGSTAEPKPALCSHRRVLAELRLLQRVYDESPDSVAVHWAPLYHGMGLVCAVLRPLYSAHTSVIIDPVEFARRPRVWPEQLSAWRATHTSSPAFGLARCADAVTDPSDLDLGDLRVVRVSSELISDRTLRRFAEVFAPAGLNPEALCPSYGMVESMLAVTTCLVGAEPKAVTVSRTAFRNGRVATSAGPADEMRLVSAGPALPETTVVILGADGRPADGEAVVGEIWIAGPQVIPVKGEEIDGVSGRRTGDMGFLSRGELVPAGRSLERFKIRGVAYYCSEVETLVGEADPRFETGRVAAFVTAAADAESQRLVVVAETGENLQQERQRLRTLATRTVSRELGIALDQVMLTPIGSLPVTTSGKIRRESCRILFETAESATLT